MRRRRVLSGAGRRRAVLPRSSPTEDAGTGRKTGQDGISVVQPRQYQRDNKSLSHRSVSSVANPSL